MRLAQCHPFLFLLPLLALLTGCGAKTTVILLPDEGREATGAVVVRTDQAAQVLDQPYTATTVTSRSAPPPPPTPLAPKEVLRDYRTLIESTPSQPASFILYFTTGTTQLTAASKAMIPHILEEAKKRAPAEISIIGHTDSTGSQAYNAKLSRQRAEAVAKLLRRAGADMRKVYISYHGENDPLVPTKDNVAEPRNRRVEIMIR